MPIRGRHCANTPAARTSGRRGALRRHRQHGPCRCSLPAPEVASARAPSQAV